MNKLTLLKMSKMHLRTLTELLFEDK